MKPKATSDEETMPYILEFSVMFVALSNSFINPIVILLTNRDYKRKIRQLLHVRCGCFEESIMDGGSDLDSSETARKSESSVRSTLHGLKGSLVILDKCSEIHTSTTTVGIIREVAENETTLSDCSERTKDTVPEFVVK